MTTRYLHTIGGSVHRIVMENSIGRKLNTNEYVHHVNGDRNDNRIENLKIVTPHEHAIIHNQFRPLTGTCVVCGKEFTPHKTKRARQQTCSWDCRNKLISMKKTAQYAVTMPHVPDWVPRGLLGTMPDTEVAKQCGTKSYNICNYRNRLGIPKFVPRRPNAKTIMEDYGLDVYKDSPSVVAREVGVSVTHIHRIRKYPTFGKAIGDRITDAVKAAHAREGKA